MSRSPFLLLPAWVALHATTALAAGEATGDATSTDSSGPAASEPSPTPTDGPDPAPSGEGEGGAQPSPAPTPEPEPEEAATPKTSWTFTGSVTFVSGYWFRGYLLHENAFIPQPAADATLTLVEDGKGLSDLWLSVGMWHSLMQMPSATPIRPHFEMDLYGGIGATFGGVVSVGATYYAYLSPGGYFAPTHELDLTVDAAIGLGDHASLTPAVTVAIEIEGQADGGEKEGVFVEPALTFEVTLPIEAWEPALSASVGAGLSPASYYELEGVNQPFGYFRANGGASLPLVFIPERAGAWSLDLGLGLFVLGPAPADAAGKTVGGMLSAGLGLEF